MSYRNAITTQKVSEFREAMPQVIAVSIKNVCLLGVGMTLAFPTILIADLLYWQDKITITQEDISWIGSISFLFVPVGCLISAPLVKKLGIKTSMLLANVPLVLVLFAIKLSNSLWHIYLGLGVFGLVLGCLDAPATFYISEVSVPKFRSVFASLTPMSFAFGQLLTFALSLFFTWRDVALITALVPILSINLLLILPESPEWLMAKGKRKDARRVLSRIRGFVPEEQIEEEFKEIEKGTELEVLDCGVFKEKKFYQPVVVGTLLGIVGSCGGAVSLGTFAVEVLREAKSPVDKYLGMFLFGVCEVLGVSFYIFAVRFLGKRKLTFVSLFFCGILLVTAALFIHLNLTKSELNLLNLNPSWIPTTSLFLFTFFTSSSIKTLPYIYFTEIHSKATRTYSTNLTISLNYLANFSCNKLFPFLLATLSLPVMLLVFSCVAFLSLFPLYFLLPETQWMSAREQEEIYAVPEDVSEHRNSLEDSSQFNFLLSSGPNTYKGFSVIDSSVI